jgi:hypothetical protein
VEVTGNMMRRKYCLVLRLALAMIFLVSFGACKKTPALPVNTTLDGLAIKGYDPVAYAVEGKAVPGLVDNEFRWKGAVWRFATSEHKALFKLNPERYAPRYGGYCAYAVSQGKTVDIDPEAWSIVDRKLYLNLNKDVHDVWEKDRDAYIRQADEHWPRMIRK